MIRSFFFTFTRVINFYIYLLFIIHRIIIITTTVVKINSCETIGRKNNYGFINLFLSIKKNTFTLSINFYTGYSYNYYDNHYRDDKTYQFLLSIKWIYNDDEEIHIIMINIRIPSIKFLHNLFPLIRNVSRVTYSRFVLGHKDVSFGSRVTTTCPQDFHESLRWWSEREKEREGGGGGNLQKGRFTAGDFV